MMILLTGATGKTGSETAKALAARGVKARALVRNAGKAAALQAAGMELVVGDVTDADCVRKALAGVSKLLLLLPNSEQQLAQEKQVVDLARAAGVRHIVKMSSMEAVPGASAPIRQIHWESEQYLRASGLAWTMIRPDFFMDNFLGSAGTIREKKLFALPLGESRSAMIDARDIGAVTAEALAGQGHEGKSHDITGPELLSCHQVAECLSGVLGTTITYVAADPQAYLGILRRVLPNEWHANAVSALFREIAEGVVPSRVTDTVRKVTGRGPFTLAQFLREHIAAFR
ncbi:MAG: SDR family oxidoreductase [Gammaproteobacteria bacterium]|nr:SDR family oxidoreductase [Gammaproteobacteria bacterium]